MTDVLLEVPLYSIRVNPYQPRRHFNDGDLRELAESLKAIGIIHPPVVRPLSEEGEYELIAGERRLRAAQLAEMQTIPVLVRSFDTLKSAQAALLENMQRADLNPIEVAYAVRNLLQDFELTQEELAERLGKKRSTIANYVRLLGLPPEIQASVAGGEITMGHAKIILSLPQQKDQALLHELIVKKNLTVRATEIQARKIQSLSSKPQKALPGFANTQLQDLRRQMELRLGTKVLIEEKNQGGGRIVIDYYNLDDFDRLLQLIGVSAED